jgi:hypothetical protein
MRQIVEVDRELTLLRRLLKENRSAIHSEENNVGGVQTMNGQSPTQREELSRKRAALCDSCVI